MLKNLTPKGIECMLGKLNSTLQTFNSNQKSRIQGLLEFYSNSPIVTPTQKIQVESLKAKFK